MVPGVSRRFHDRQDAGARLAGALDQLRDQPGVVILGMARGGVPVAAEVARALDAPLDVLVVRKLGAPGNPELALGAIAATGEHLDHGLVRATGTTSGQLEAIRRRERAELQRREASWRSGRPALPLAGRTVVVVDDGLATGSSAIAALEAVRAQAPARLILAVPVAPPDSLEVVRSHADSVVCLETPEPFGAVGAWYDDFAQTEDSDVVRHLAEADRRCAASHGAHSSP